MRCLVCRLNLDNREELKRHWLTHDDSEVKRFSCHLCELKFLKFFSLVRHQQRIHLRMKAGSSTKLCSLLKEIKGKAYEQLTLKEESDQNPLDNEEAEFRPSQKLYVCEYEDCRKVFVHQTSYVMHKRCVHSELRNFTCELCSKSFKTSSNLYVHIKQHKNQRDHPCQLCPLSFFTSSHLKAHLKIHSKSVRYFCDVEGCGKSFIHLSSYKKHNNFHRGLKAHKCNVCQRHFAQLCHLRQHMKIHTNERNHCCAKCEKAFRRADTLRIHLKTHDS